MKKVRVAGKKCLLKGKKGLRETSNAVYDLRKPEWLNCVLILVSMYLKSFEACSSPLSLSQTLGFPLNRLEWPVCPLCIVDTEVKHEIKHSRLLFPSDSIGLSTGVLSCGFVRHYFL